MQIKKEKIVVTGKHNDVDFKYDDKILTVYGCNFSQDRIKVVVEIANLLHLQGFSLRTSLKEKIMHNLFGSYTVTDTTDEEENNG